VHVIRHDNCRLEIDNLLFLKPSQTIKDDLSSPWLIKYPLFVVGRGGEEVIMPLEGGSTLSEISRAFERFHRGLFGVIAAGSRSHKNPAGAEGRVVGRRLWRFAEQIALPRPIRSRLEAAPTGK